MQAGYDDIKQMLAGAIEIIRQKNAELSLLDTAIGDGDHGVTMLRAMEKINQVNSAHSDANISNLLNEIGWALLDIDGGAVGPLYGSLFLGMAEATSGQESLSPDHFAQMFEGGLESIEKQTKARVGDKTMMDALIPAVQALRTCADQGQSIAAMLDMAAAAATAGAESTRNIAAHYGRAKFQGERTLGHPDPGSVSTAYLFQGMRAGLSKT